MLLISVYIFLLLQIAMNIPTPGLFTSGNFKQDGYALLAKFIRTKDINSLQESSDKGKGKLEVSIAIPTYIIYNLI